MMEKKEKIIYAICYGVLSLAFVFTSNFIFRTLFKEPGFIIIIKLLYAIVFLLSSYMIATSVIKIFNKESGKMIYEKLYDKFKLDKEEGEEEMVDVKEFAVNIGDLWYDIYRKLEDKYPDRDYGSIYRIEGIYQEDGATFAIIRRKDEEKLYKLDFEISDENGIVCSDEVVEVECTFVEKDEVKKFEEPENVDKLKAFEEPEEKDEDDDKEETVRHRLEVYRNQTRPLVDYYSGWAKTNDPHAPRYSKVQGVGSVDVIRQRLFSSLA